MRQALVTARSQPPLGAADLPRGLAAIAIVTGAAILGQVATTRGLPWYFTRVRKPPETPPAAAFPVAWTVLFGCIGVALFRLWRAPPSPERERALGWYAVQLAFNVAWSYVFFALRAPFAALFVALGLAGSAAATCVTAARVDRLAGRLFAPYVAWVSFASWLNLRIVLVNRD
jgi:tryptophan-rich sensory protein